MSSAVVQAPLRDPYALHPEEVTEAPKTKDFLTALDKIEANGTTLVVSAGQDKNLFLASRNIQYVELTTSAELNTYQALKYDKIVFTKGAFEKVQERLTVEK